MYSEIVVVENNGPPPVMISCKSKKFILHTVIRIRFVTINCLKSGIVIKKNLFIFVAPSISAAS